MKAGSRKKHVEVLKIEVEAGLMDMIRQKAESLEMDVYTYAGWCLQTGVILGDLNAFVRTRMRND